MENSQMKINTYDIDGVIYINKDIIGITPLSGDIIITGRSFEEIPETKNMLKSRNISNHVYYNMIPFDQKCRESSGIHKGNTLNLLKTIGYEVGVHFEDDEIQIEQIKIIAPWVNIIHINHNLVEKENVRHTEWI
jgi:hypothetical protein